MNTALEAVHAARRQVLAAACRAGLATLALADMSSPGPALPEAEEALDKAAAALAAAKAELVTERRQSRGLLL